MNGSPSNYIISSICNELIKSYERHVKLSQAENIPFLCVFEYFEILSDLILLIPSCAPALYNNRTATLGKKNNNRSLIAYFLHTILPQPRENTKLLEKKDNDECGFELDSRKRHYYLGLRTAQSCARTLVAIVARPGEGRRKVLSELSHAFGEIRMNQNDDTFMRSLQVSVLLISIPRMVHNVFINIFHFYSHGENFALDLLLLEEITVDTKATHV